MLKNIMKAHELHTQVSKKEVGKDTHAYWTALTNSMVAAGHKVYANTHDTAGRKVSPIDPEQAQKDEQVLFNNLKNLQTLLGEIPFKTGETAPLELNEELGQAVANASAKWGWEYSEEVQAIKEELADAKADLKFAQLELERHSFNGVNPDRIAQIEEEIEELSAICDEIDERRKDAENKPHGKKWVPLPNDESKFRLALAEIIYSAAMNQSAMDYDTYKAMKKAQKEKRKERTRKNKQRKAQLEQAQAQAE